MSEGKHQVDPARWSIEPAIPAAVGAVVVFGGAFDPPHFGHIEPALAARDAIGAGWVLYVPAARSPLKESGPTARGKDRIEMLRLALSGRERWSVTDVEIERGGVSYTLDTLRSLRAALPGGAVIRLLIGADQAASFHAWREPGMVMELAEPVVMLREPDESAVALLERMAPHWSDAELERWRGRIVPTPMRRDSSTAVRAALASSDHEAAARLIPADVLSYIRGRGLYG